MALAAVIVAFVAAFESAIVPDWLLQQSGLEEVQERVLAECPQASFGDFDLAASALVARLLTILDVAEAWQAVAQAPVLIESILRTRIEQALLAVHYY